MRIYTSERTPDLRSGLLGLLLAAFDTEPSEIWLVTPWLRDIVLPVADQGHFASLFGGQRDEVRLVELLARLGRRHRIHVVSKPFDELVPLRTASRIRELLDDRDRLRADEDVRAYEVAERVLATLGEEIAALSRIVTQHADTVNTLAGLVERGVNVHVLPRLHAKLLWTPAGAILGSANFTHGGMAVNEELMTEVSATNQLSDLLAAAQGFAERGAALDGYSLRPSLRTLGMTERHFRELLARFADEPALQEATTLMQTLERHLD